MSGYQIVVRLFLAVMGSLGLSAGALAGVIEGVVVFPSRLTPSMTLYASDLDTSRLHSVQLARGQAKFTIEVPTGRYVVFLAPNEPGAPNIYGAYTQYSLCTAHDAGHNCDDHALVAVAVSGKSARAAVTIDDWYVTDVVADQLDRIRGSAGEPPARFDPELLSAPRFSEYPNGAFDASAPPELEVAGNDLSDDDREILRRALAGGPNFAGHVTAALRRCGPGCGRLVLIDWSTGAVQAPSLQSLTEIQGTLPCRNDEALLIRRDSRLMSISRVHGNAVVTEFYVWNQKSAALVQSSEYQRSSQSFCAIAAR